MKQKSNDHILFIILLIVLLFEILLMCIWGFQIGKLRSFQNHLSLGDKYFSEANYEDAEIHYLKAIDIDKKNITGYINLSYMYTETGQYDKAEDILERAQENIKAKKHDELITTRLKTLEDTQSEQSQNNANVQVLDGFSDAFTESLYNTQCCYHIPQIQIDNISNPSINTKIYNELNNILSQNVYQDPACPEISQMVYDWGYSGHLISIIIETDALSYDWTEYYIYNYSITTDAEAANDDILSYFGLSQQDYEELVKNTLQQYMDNWNAQVDLSHSEGTIPFEVLLEKTLSEENIKGSRPFINAEGELCFVAKIYSPAAADYYYHMLNTTVGKEPHIEWLKCDIHK